MWQCWTCIVLATQQWKNIVASTQRHFTESRAQNKMWCTLLRWCCIHCCTVLWKYLTNGRWKHFYLKKNIIFCWETHDISLGWLILKLHQAIKVEWGGIWHPWHRYSIQLKITLFPSVHIDTWMASLLNNYSIYQWINLTLNKCCLYHHVSTVLENNVTFLTREGKVDLNLFLNI